jgi:acyl carrier protein
LTLRKSAILFGKVMTLNEIVLSNRDRISDLVIEILTRRSPGTTVDIDQDLRERGLTSIDMVNLMLTVEAEFDIQIPEAEMTPQNFRSISAIDTLVSALLPDH